MIKEFEQIRYKFDEQKRIYSSISKDISLEEKNKILRENIEGDIWAYFQLSVEILYDICSDEDDYIAVIEKFYNKIRTDMASGPFFEILIRIGNEKPDIALSLYKKINQGTNDELKAISGLILGGYSIKEGELLNKLLEVQELKYPLTNLTLKAILVKYEKEDAITEKVKSFLNLVSKSDDEIFIKELMNLCIFLYKSDENYFYKMIKELMEKKKSRVNEMIFIRCKKLNFTKEQFLELAELTKDCDEYALNEMTYAIMDYSEEVEKIASLFIYWINKDLEFKIRNFDWILKELSKKNPRYIEYLLDNYSKLNNGKLGYFHLFPRIFEEIITDNIPQAITLLISKEIDKKDKKLFYELTIKIIGFIYKSANKKQSFDLFLPLAKKIEEIAEGLEFVNYNNSIFESIVKKENFDELINYTSYLLNALRFRKQEFDLEAIDKNLTKHPELYKTIKSNLDKIKSQKKYSPLFWLGEQERDKELKEAYLEVLEKYLVLSTSVTNEECSDNSRALINNLGEENGFFDFFSEAIFINKFITEKDKFKPVIEPKIPNKSGYADLLINLNKRSSFFEIKNSKTDRNLELDNGAVMIKNRVDKIFKEKSKQFFNEKTFKEMQEGKRTDLYFIVVDADNSTIDEYMVLNSFFGSLAYQFYRNNETGETTEPELIRKDDAIAKDKQIVSGLIYFKKQLVNKDGEIKFILIGDLIVNPYAVNQPTKEEVEELKKILFSA